MCLFNTLSDFLLCARYCVRQLVIVMNLPIKVLVVMRDKKKAKDQVLGNEEILLRRQSQQVQNNHCDKYKGPFWVWG